MTDVLSKEQRSYTMSKIRKVDTKPELKVRSYLFKEGFRYRLYSKGLQGNPDIVLKKYKSVIFINGCFWHAHEGCKLNRFPKTRQDYWIPKILKTVERDKINIQKLTEQGWKVFTVWECELSKDKLEHTMQELIKKIKKRTVL